MLEQKENAVYFRGAVNSPGLHARSAAFIVRWTAGLDARVTVEALDGPRPRELLTFSCQGGTGVFLLLSALAVRPGTQLRFTARGPDAAAALYEVRRALEEEPPPTFGRLGVFDQARLEAWAER